MSTEHPKDLESELDEILDHCNALRQAPVPDDASLPAGYTGTLGHFPVYFPEELAHSAGLLPVGILGGGNKLELKHADAHMGSFVCSICRSTTELGLSGALKNLAGFVTHPICNAAKHLGEEIQWKPGGRVEQRAHEVLKRALDLLETVRAETLWSAIARGAFADVKRAADGGKGLEGVFPRAPDYLNPILERLEGRA